MDLADQILAELPREATFGEMLARLNKDVAQLNAHYDNSRWIANMGAALEDITADMMTLTLDVAGRRFRIDIEKVLHIAHLGELAPYLQEEETTTGMGKIVAVAESVRAIYDLAFPREGDAEHGDANAGETMQPVRPAQAGK